MVNEPSRSYTIITLSLSPFRVNVSVMEDTLADAAEKAAGASGGPGVKVRNRSPPLDVTLKVPLSRPGENAVVFTANRATSYPDTEEASMIFQE